MIVISNHVYRYSYRIQPSEYFKCISTMCIYFNHANVLYTNHFFCVMVSVNDKRRFYGRVARMPTAATQPILPKAIGGSVLQ